MLRKKVYTAIGLMSGTSLDGVDAALIETDGKGIVRPIGFVSAAYPTELRDDLRACFGRAELDEHGKNAEREMTHFHAALVLQLMEKFPQAKPSLIGFHGQTILHDTGAGRTVQIGDGELLAAETGIDVVYDFRSADMHASGQGAPLAPIYHAARARQEKINRPVSFLNIGGVANITWVGEGEDELVAFDTGTGNALMDDYAKEHLGVDYDPDGSFASTGTVDEIAMIGWMTQEYFKTAPPKSLDRNEWDIAEMGPLAKGLIGLAPQDGLATLLEFSAQGVLKAFDHLPQPPEAIYVSGGGRHNTTLMKRLAEILPCEVHNVDVLGWDGDATEAECFAYLAVRSKLGLPISFPGTTGVAEPLTGGVLVESSVLAKRA